MNEFKMASFASAPNGQAAKSEPKNISGLQYNVALGYLRAFIIVLVVAYHAVLPFHLIAPPFPASSLVTQPRLWPAFPVVDGQHSMILAVFHGFNDIYFMSLMFFLSGLFVWNSLHRKGNLTFLRDRLIRLGLPFMVMVLLVPPLAFYPTYLQTGSSTGLSGFWQQWRDILQSLDWPKPAAWFIWILLAFDCIAVLLFVLTPRWGEVFGRLSLGVLRRPAPFFGLLVVISAAVYIPMVLSYDPYLGWPSWGPFEFQSTRLFLYAVYFLAGFILGTYGIERTLLAPAGMLARRWVVWVVLALGAFILSLSTSGLGSLLGLSNPILATIPQTWGTVVMGFTFVLSCAVSSFAFTAIFLRFARTRRKIFDSLSANGYGIYVIHYMVVSWLLYIFLKAPLPAIAKGPIVFLFALALCWGVIAIVRRIPALARVI